MHKLSSLPDAPASAASTSLQHFCMPQAPRRVLVVCLRRLGDVLLTTPLIRSLRRAWPKACIEVLVYESAAAILQGNPDIDRVIVEPQEGARVAKLKLAFGLLRRYDLAISTLYNDRPHAYALLASRRRVNVVPPMASPGAAWKRRLSSGWSELALGAHHAVDEYLRLADVLGIERVAEVVPPSTDDTTALEGLLGAGWREVPTVVVHPVPLYRYKSWADAGWQAAIEHLVLTHGLRVVVSGGPGDVERERVAAIVRGLTAAAAPRVVDAAGRLALAELAVLLRGARAYLGPDTAITHLAAACGTPTVALFGPSHPVAWGPWPPGTAATAGSPWRLKSPLQRSGSVWLLQGEGDCVPCLQEGCERHLASRADCLDELAARRVCNALDEALAPRRVRLPPLVAALRESRFLGSPSIP